MEFSLIGTGDVGRNLGAGLVEAGHAVVYGSREPADDRVRGLVADLGRPARATTVAEAIRSGMATVLALPADAAIAVATEHADALAGLPVIDPTNRYPEAGDRPVAHAIADAAPAAGVVKAFNTVGAERLRDPVIGVRPASMFVAGDDPPAKELALSLAADLGFEPVDVGGLDRAGRLEELARLWIDLSGSYGRDIAFSLLGA